MQKKPNRISIREVSEKNALITDRRNARIETENNQKNNDNKRGCNNLLLGTNYDTYCERVAVTRILHRPTF